MEIGLSALYEQRKLDNIWYRQQIVLYVQEILTISIQWVAMQKWSGCLEHIVE